jgi:hypothetical protein
MAITQRKRIIANPGRRRNARKMSAKQRAIFGRTPAIRAAAKASLRRKRAHGLHRNRSRSNPSEIIGFTLANPARRKGHKMARRRTHHRKENRRRVNRSRRNPAHSHRRKHHSYTHHRRSNRRRHNPRYRMNRRHHRRNPGMGQFGGYLTNAAFVLVGALGSKLGAQLILGANNTGWIGYGMNAIVGAGLWFITERVMKNKEAASGVIAGTLVEIILRIINDMTPFGSYVSGLGMGDYMMQSFVTPQVLVDPYNNAQIQIPNGWAPTTVVAPAHAAAAAAAPAGMGDMYGDTYSGAGTYGY